MIDSLTAGDAALPPWATGPSDAGVPDADWVHQHQAALAQMTADNTPDTPSGAEPNDTPPTLADDGTLPAWAAIGQQFTKPVGDAISALGSNLRRALDNPSEGTKRAFAAGEESELATGGKAIGQGGQELMANSFDVPEGAAGLLAQKAVHGLTGVPGREEQEAERRMTGNPLADLGTIGAINREATSRAPEDLQKAKAVAELGTWLPGTAASIGGRLIRGQLAFERGLTESGRVGDAALAQADLGVSASKQELIAKVNALAADPGATRGERDAANAMADKLRAASKDDPGLLDQAQALVDRAGPRPGSLDAQGRPAGLDVTEAAPEGVPANAGQYARLPGPAPHPDAVGPIAVRAVDGSHIADIHPANVPPEAAREIADALELGRVDPATLPRTVALARALNAAMTPTIDKYSPEALEVRKQDAIAREIARQDAVNPNPSREGTVAFVTGPPGSGKSNVVANQVAQELKAQVADLDALAQHFSGYNDGITKNTVHLETDRAMPDFLNQIADGRNLVIPIVGANAEKVARMIANVRARGYGTVYNFHVDVPTEQSVIRTTERYERGGMYLPHEYAADPRLRARSRASFDAVKESSDGYASYDNSGPRGSAPQLTEASPGLPHLLRQLRGGDRQRARPEGLSADAARSWDAAQRNAGRIVPGAFSRGARRSSVGGVNLLPTDGLAVGTAMPGSTSFASAAEKMADVSYGGGGPGAAAARKATNPRAPRTPAQVDAALRNAKDDTGQPFNTEVSPQDLPYAATENGYINVLVSPSGKFWVDTGAATDHRSTLAEAGLMESYDYAKDRHGQDTIYDSMKRNGILRGAVTNAGHPVHGGWTGGNRGTLRLEFATPPTDAQTRALRAAMEDGNLDFEWEVDHPRYLANGKEDDPTSVNGEGLPGLNRELAKLRIATTPTLGPGAAAGLPARQGGELAQGAWASHDVDQYINDPEGEIRRMLRLAGLQPEGHEFVGNDTLVVHASAETVPGTKVSAQPLRGVLPRVFGSEGWSVARGPAAGDVIASAPDGRRIVVVRDDVTRLPNAGPTLSGGESSRGAARLGPGAAAVPPPTQRGTFAKLRPGMDVDRAADKLIGKGLDGKLTAADAEELLRFIDRRTDLPARASATVQTRLEEIVGAQDEADAAALQVAEEFKKAIAAIRAEVSGAKADMKKAATGLAHVGRDALESQRTITRQAGRATTAAGRALQDRLAAASGQLASDTDAAASARDASAAAPVAVTSAHTNEPVEYGGAINPRRPGVAENAAAVAAHEKVVRAVQAKVTESAARLDALVKDSPTTGEAPAHQVAAALRRAAAAVNAEIAKLPKRGLVGSRASAPAPAVREGGIGSSADLSQSEAQRGRPGELTLGSNSFRPTGARLGLERRRDQLLEAARAISAPRAELITLEKQLQVADMSVADQIRWAARRGELDPTQAREYAAMATAGRESQALAGANAARDPELAPLTFPDYTHVDGLHEQRADATDRLAKALERAKGLLPAEVTGNLPELARSIATELRNLRSALKAIEPPEITEVAPLSEYAKKRGILRQGPKYSPETYELIKDAVTANPDEYARRLQSLSFADAINDLAPNIGIAPETFRTMLAKRGELIGPTVAAKIATEFQAQKLAQIARVSGRATDEYALEYGKFVSLVMDLTEGVSEVARTLGAQAIYARASTARAIDAAHLRAKAEAQLKAATAAQLAYERAVARAEEDAALAAAQAEAAHGDAVLRIAADTLVRRQAALEQARMMAEAGRASLARATEAYNTAAAQSDTRAEAARQAIIAKAIKAGIDPEHVKVLGSFSPYEVEGMARYLGSVKSMKGGEMIYAAMVNSMLMAPTSVIKHLMGTIIVQEDRRMTELLQATVTGPIIARLTGRTNVATLSRLRVASAAYLGALPSGVAHMLSTYTLGIDPTQTDIRASLVGRGPRILGTGVRLGDVFTLGTRAHIAQNAPFWAAERPVAQTLFAWADALDQLRGELGREPSGDELNERGLDLLNDPHYIGTIEPRVREAAYSAGMMGKTSAFTKLIGQALGMAKVPEWVPAVGNFPFLRAFVPFMGIADRVAVMGIQRMPGFVIAGGLVTGHPELSGIAALLEVINDLNAVRNGKDEEAAHNAARQLNAIAIGIPILAAVSALVAQGLITGSAPAKQADYDQWTATGRQPYSVKVNGSWYRWDWIEPFAFMLKIGLSAQGAWDDPKAQTPDAKLVEFAGRAGKAITDSTYMRGLGTLIAGVANPGSPVANAVQSVLVAIANPASGLSRPIAQQVDPYQRATTNFLEALVATLPWLSKGLPAKPDIYGRPIPNTDNPLLPWKGTEDTPDPVSDAFADVQAHVPNFAMPGPETARVGQGLNLDGHELVRFQELAGAAIYTQAAKVINGVTYKGLPYDERAKALEGAIREGHTLGKQQLANELMGLDQSGAPVAQTSPRERALGITLGLSAAPGNYERLETISKWLPVIDKDPALADALDTQLRAASTQFASDGKLTLADFRKVVPYLRQLEQIPEFEEGTPAQWAQYHQELAVYNQKLKLDPTREQASAYRDTHPVLDNFMWLASHGGKNPGLADLIDQEPLLKRIPLPRDRT